LNPPTKPAAASRLVPLDLCRPHRAGTRAAAAGESSQLQTVSTIRAAAAEAAEAEAAAAAEKAAAEREAAEREAAEKAANDAEQFRKAGERRPQVTSPSPQQAPSEAATEKNTSIENAIGAIILALALTISDSNPRTNTKKGVGANTKTQRTDEEIEKIKKEYDELTTQIATITEQRVDIEKKFNEIKTAPGNKKNKKEGLIRILNDLLSNKQKVAVIKHPNYDEPSGVRPVDDKPSGLTGGQGCAYSDRNPDQLCSLAVEFYNSRNIVVFKKKLYFLT
jgi:hypothetical protein